MKSTSTLKTVKRAFEVLDSLWDNDGLTPKQLATDMDIPLSTAHSYLHTLAETGYIDRDNGMYRPGYKFFTKGNQLKNRNTLYHKSKPELQRISDETGEMAIVHVEYRGKMMLLHLEEGKQAFDVGVFPGIIAPLHTQAGGKVILAHFSSDRVRDIVETRGLKPVTEHTITDFDTLVAELEAVRENGVCADWNQQVIGMGMVAAPLLINDEESSNVRGADVDVLGSVAISCPTGRLRNDDYRSNLISSVQEAADTIVVNYQYGGI